MGNIHDAAKELGQEIVEGLANIDERLSHEISEAMAEPRARLQALEERVTALEGNKPPVEPPPPPPPPPGSPEIRVTPEDFAIKVQGAPERARILMAPGVYTTRNVRPKNGQTLEATGPDVIWRGQGSGFEHAISGSDAHDVSIFGPIRFERWGGRGLSPPLNSNPGWEGRLAQEVAIIHPNVTSYPRRAQNWICRGLEVDDARWLEGIKLGEGFEVHDSTFRHVALGVSGEARLIRIRHCLAEHINEVGAASHHHTGWAKLTGGRRNWAVDDDHPDALFPPREGSEITGCRARNLLNTRGLWIDWDVVDALVEDYEVDGSDFEGLVIEASARVTARNIRLDDCCRVKTSDRWLGSPEWRTAVMFQNAKGCTLEDATIHKGRHMEAAIGLAHHNRGHEDPDRLGINAGHTVGRFVGMDNVFRRIRVESDIDKILHQGIDSSFPPSAADVRSSNRTEGVEIF